jgi:hypothetical protein
MDVLSMDTLSGITTFDRGETVSFFFPPGNTDDRSVEVFHVPKKNCSENFLATEIRMICVPCRLVFSPARRNRPVANVAITLLRTSQ